MPSTPLPVPEVSAPTTPVPPGVPLSLPLTPFGPVPDIPFPLVEVLVTTSGLVADDVMLTALLMVWAPVNVLATASCGTFVVSTFTVTVPLVPPPVRSVPAVTPVIVPVPGDAQAQALPLHCRICFAAQAVVRDRLSVPL